MRFLERGAGRGSAETGRAGEGLLDRLTRVTVRRRRAVIVGSVVTFVVTQAFGLGAIDRLSTGGFDSPDSQAAVAAAHLEETFGVGDPDLVFLVTAKNGSVDDGPVAELGRRLTGDLQSEPGVEDAFSYWSLGGASPLRASDGDAALVVVRFAGDLDQRNRLAERIVPRYTVENELVDVRAGGFQEVFRQTTAQIEEDLVRLELIVAPVLLALLLIVFRSVVAALLPLAVGAVAVAGTLAILRLAATATEVSIFALNLTTTLGLGLAIDYSLFIVSRFREEVAAGATVEEAVARSLRTAGRTVVFSALTVAASLASLLVFPLVVLRSFAYAGIPVVLLAAAGAVVTLPALLAATGDGLERWAVRKPTQREVGEGWWHRIAVAVMRRPVPVASAVVLFLVVLGTPFLRIELGSPDDRVLPADAPVRSVHDQLRADFAGAEAFPIVIVGRSLPPPQARAGDLDRYAMSLSQLPGVLRVDTEVGSYATGDRLLNLEELSQRFRRPSATYLSVVPAVEPMSLEAQHLVAAVRALDAPFPVEVTGRAAQLVDDKGIILSRLPVALTLIAVVTFVVLFLAFGSVVVPVKAVLLNLLSLTATFGAMVWVFQEGHLASLLGFTPTGTLDMGTPILMFAIAFGISMDYEVFLLSRIQEEYERCGDNTTAVAVGLERTGRLITAAAALIAVVFLVSSLSGVSIMKMFGLGLALAVIVDATLVRATLVPAFMRLAGDLNWWAPRWMAPLHTRFGVRHGHTVPADVAVTPAPGALP